MQIANGQITNGKYPVGKDPMGKNSVGNDLVSNDPLGNDPSGNDPLGNAPLGNENNLKFGHASFNQFNFLPHSKSDWTEKTAGESNICFCGLCISLLKLAVLYLATNLVEINSLGMVYLSSNIQNTISKDLVELQGV